MHTNTKNEIIKLEGYLVAYATQTTKQWFVEDINQVLMPKLRNQLEFELSIEDNEE